MSTSTPTSSTTELLAAAAAAAAAQIPSSTPLVLGPTDGTLAPQPTGTAVVAGFTGAVSGTVAVIVDPALEAALAGAEGGPLPLADAVAPALQAAIAAIGPAVPGPVEAVPAAGPVSRSDISWAPLVGDGEVSAWVGLAVAAGSAPVPPAATVPGPRAEASSLNLLRDVEMVLTVELGRTRMSVRELLSLAPGSVVELDRAAGAPADLMVNGRLLARGEVVVVDEDYGLRITEIIEPGAEG
jgi:flagellar motor switch protein FliN/FliY